MSNQHIAEIIKEMESDILRPDLIQDNKLHFSCNNMVLRVRMPNQLELLKATEKKNEYEIQLLNRENTLTLKQLKKTLKEKGIDISKMEADIIKLDEKSLLIYDKLVKKQDTETEAIESDKKELEDIKKEKNEILDEISKRISPSIDIQAENYYVSYLTSICTEKSIEEENNVIWKSLWESFDDYLKEESSDLKFYSMGYLTQLMMKVK